MSDIEKAFLPKDWKKNKDKISGLFRAIVDDINDPEKLGRIKVKCPELYGDDQSPWAWPCLPFGGSDQTGFFFLPEKGAGVWVSFEQGSIDHPVWMGVWWTKPNNSNEVPNESRGSDYGLHQVIKTKSGHTIEIIDKSGSEKIIIKEKNGGTITLENGSFSVGSGDHPIGLGDIIAQIFDSHTHSFSWSGTSGSGNTGVPSSLMGTQVQSTVSNTE